MNNQDTEQEFDPFGEPEKRRRGSGVFVASLALLIAFGLAGFEAWQWWQQRQEQGQGELFDQQVASVREAQVGVLDEVHSLGERLGRLEAQEFAGDLAELTGRVARLEERLRGADLDSDATRKALEEAAAVRGEVVERLASIEAGMSALAARSQSPAISVELAEVEFLLRVASERLQLFGDGNSARQALEMADRELDALDDPLYLPVRRDIAQALRALSRMERVDVLSLSSAIAGLQSDIPGLPFPGDEEARSQPYYGGDASEAPGIWARFKAALRGLVTVRRKVPEDSLLSLEDRDYVRQGLWLQLETARLALMRLDDEWYQQALERARATLAEHFAQGSGAVARFRQELDELAGAALGSELPDISGPWSRLKLLRTGRESEKQKPAGEEPGAAGEPAADALADPGDDAG